MPAQPDNNATVKSYYQQQEVYKTTNVTNSAAAIVSQQPPQQQLQTTYYQPNPEAGSGVKLNVEASVYAARTGGAYQAEVNSAGLKRIDHKVNNVNIVSCNSWTRSGVIDIKRAGLVAPAKINFND